MNVGKRCRKCGEDNAEFHRNNARPDGLADWCKSCMKANQKQRLADPEVRKRHIEQVKARYANLTPDQRAVYVKRGAARRKETAGDLRLKYGVTFDQYQEILEAQGGGCAICGRRPQKDARRMPVDHDHACCPGMNTCGTCIRGILCTPCNAWLGFYENKVWMDRAAKYLQQGNPASFVRGAVDTGTSVGVIARLSGASESSLYFKSKEQ